MSTKPGEASGDSGEASGEKCYALYVRSHFERTTEEALKGKGYNAFSPFYSVLRKRPDRTKKVELPLFPGYVFCFFNPNRRLPILETPGVVKIVGFGNVPEPVRLEEIQSIQLVVESGRPLRPWPSLHPGQKVRIDAGPLSGIEGTLLRVKDEVHLVVSITLLQRSVSVVLDQDSVRPLLGKQGNPDPLPASGQ